MIWWKVLLCILFGYLVGNINPAYIIGRLRGIDVRKKGSGNAGASNASTRCFPKRDLWYPATW